MVDEEFDVQHVSANRDHEYTHKTVKGYPFLQHEGSRQDGKNRCKTQIRDAKGQGCYPDRTEIYVIGKNLKGNGDTYNKYQILA